MVKHFNNEDIKEILITYGIDLDVSTGIISYNKKTEKCTLNSRALWFMRHGETIASQNNCFMSLSSYNSRLSKDGIKMIEKNINYIKNMGFDVVIFSPLPRVVETVEIIKKNITTYKYECLDYLLGIDNATWSGKKLFEFTEQQKNDYISREYLHNVFAKAKGGNCWADVLINCIEFIEFINENYIDKNILLVSQESVLWGIKIITHAQTVPWDNYNAKKIFNLDNNEPNSYGQILRIQ
mgnify:CR=1 FL=1